MGFSPSSIRLSAFRRPANHSSSYGRLTFGLVAILALGFVVAAPNAGQAQAASIGPVKLGTAAHFSVIGATTVTNVGTSTMAGDLGLYPGSSVTGFSTVPTGIGGTTHVSDAVALKAQNDVVIAYNDAAAQTPSVTGVGDLTGQTLTPGTYNGGELSVTGTLRLHGGAESVWVFQAASTLITASASRVEITGGASACNVYWKVGSSATLGAGSKFVGTILAYQSITAATGTTVDGRLLARVAAVTLDHTTIITSDACTESAASSSGGSTDSTTTTGTTGTATGTDSTSSSTTPTRTSPTSPSSTTPPTTTPPRSTPPFDTPPSAGGSVLTPGECTTAVRGTPYETDISTSIDGLPSTPGGGAGAGSGGSSAGSSGSGSGSGDAGTTADSTPVGDTPHDGSLSDTVDEPPVGGAPHNSNPADDTNPNGSPGNGNSSDSAPAARYEVVEGTLPPGLNLDSETGRISGTPTAADTYDLTVQVTEAPEHTASEADASGSSSASSSGGHQSHPTVSSTSQSPGGDSSTESSQIETSSTETSSTETSRTETSTGGPSTGRSFITGSYVTGSVAKDLTYDFSITVVEPTTVTHHSQNGAPRTSVASSAIYPKMWTGSGSSRTHYAAGEQRPTMLAFTGADPLGAILLSLALVISGAALFIWRRRLVTSGNSSVR